MYKSIIIAFLLVLTACTNKPDRGSAAQPSSHQHDDEGTQYTLFSEQFEFFIEHPPLEAGREKEFLVHLTDLATYKPCSTGNVTIHIDGVSVTSGQATTPGIFNVPFIAKKEGEFHVEFTYKNGDISETVEEHVHVYKDHDEIHAGETDDGGHSHGSQTLGEIEFLKEQAWKAEFMVKEINPGPFHKVINTSGEIMAVPGERQNITANSPGIVRFVNPLLVQGSPVKKGQLLFTISSESLVEDKVKLRYEEAKNRLEKSRSVYQRHQVLYEQEAISERQYVESKTTYVEDSLRYFSLAANITESGVKVVAPVTGTIHELIVSDGEYTEAGRMLAIMSSNKTLLLRADLPQQYYASLKEIRSAHFRPAYTKQVFKVEELNGSLLSGFLVAVWCFCG